MNRLIRYLVRLPIVWRIARAMSDEVRDVNFQRTYYCLRIDARGRVFDECVFVRCVLVAGFDNQNRGSQFVKCALYDTALQLPPGTCEIERHGESHD